MSAKAMGYVKIGLVAFAVIVSGMLIAPANSNNVKHGNPELLSNNVSMIEGQATASPCDILRSCAFSKYSLLDDGISAAPIIADAIIASCRSEYEMCADSVLLDAGAEFRMIQDRDVREGVLQTVKRDWIVPMVLAARVRMK